MDGLTPETCAECGFDAARWTRRDAASFLDALGAWWEQATAPTATADLLARPAPGVWSVLQYGLHTSLVLALHAEGIGRLLETDGLEVSLPPGTAGGDLPESLERPAVLAGLPREGAALAGVARRGSDGWGHVGFVDGMAFQAEAALFHAAHDASHHLLDVSRGLVAVAGGAPGQRGSVARLGVSGGGVPKAEIDEVAVSAAGLAGDVQADRKHHGRPFQAVCLWSTEVIAELAALGHPIGPGDAGENVTISGLDWSAIRPGNRIEVGSAVVEVSFPATPCAKQSRWFSDGDFGRIDHDRNPGWTRWYGWVRTPGRIRTGDAVTVLGSA